MDLTPLLISTTSESLLPNHRSYLKKVFNAEVFDQYGSGELSAISYECAQHTGLHINQEHIMLEVLDHNSKPILEKQAG